MRSFLVLLALTLLLSAAFQSCTPENTPIVRKEFLSETYSCNAETIDGDVFTSDTLTFGNGTSQTDLYAHSGKYSCLVKKGQQYGFTSEFSNVKKGELIYAKVWMYSEGNPEMRNLIIADDSQKQYDSSWNRTKKEGDWVLIENTFLAQNDYDVVKVYCLNTSVNPLYADDIEITRQFGHEKPPLTDEALRIFIPDHEYALLDSFLTEGRKVDILKKELKKYVNGFILSKNDSLPIKLRLKGDWTDHLKSEKYSLRIKVRGDHAFNGLKSFSIQSPETRSMMKEWYIHELCAYEDVLTTTYTFVNVEINGEVKGIYALEETLRQTTSRKSKT